MSADITAIASSDDDDDILANRPGNPVRFYDDLRIAYWTGGRPGLGKRLFERCRDREHAKDRVLELRRQLHIPGGLRGKAVNATLDEMMQAYINYLRENNGESGTWRQYKGDWNRWVPKSIGSLRCRDVYADDLSAIFNHLVTHPRRTKSAVIALERTLNSAIGYGVENGYFGLDEPFHASRTMRRSIAKRARRQMKHVESTRTVALEQCPSMADIDAYAQAFDEVYPWYGKRLVWAGFATGGRLLEVLAFKEFSVDSSTGRVAINEQLLRYEPFPATSPPKRTHVREALVLSFLMPTMVELADRSRLNAADPGWFFPRTNAQGRWADKVQSMSTIALRESGWAAHGWGYHWLRHAYASVCIAPEDSGGYGCDPDDVRKWLGHKHLSTTTGFYVQGQQDGVRRAREVTRRPPGKQPLNERRSRRGKRQGRGSDGADSST